MQKTEFDAVVVGSGPNGLAAAITMQQAGLSVLLIEGKETIGGGMRSAELTLPGFVHDVCSAIHPLLTLSPFFASLPLRDFGLKLIQPDIAAAHPSENGDAAVLNGSVEATAAGLGADGAAYFDLMAPVVKNLPEILPDLLGPLRFPGKPFKMAAFGLKGLPSALFTGKKFVTGPARGLWAGMAAHSMQPLQNLTTSAFAIILMAAAHLAGWPVPVGGSQSIADAMGAYFLSLGGKIETGSMISSLRQLPDARAVLMDVTPKQLLAIAGDRLSTSYRARIGKYRYGMGVFKIDWALSGQIPFVNEHCRKAGTVHLGNTMQEIVSYEQNAALGRHAENPFVILAQQSIADTGRAPEGKHTAWAYCHVPHGSQQDMTAAIETQVERFAPGFRNLIIGRSTMNTVQMEAYNPNYVGGDINGGIQDLRQLYARPVWGISPYRTSEKGLYLCSSSTPPGGGVHGMCGYNAARQALKDIFKIEITPVKGVINNQFA